MIVNYISFASCRVCSQWCRSKLTCIWCRSKSTWAINGCAEGWALSSSRQTCQWIGIPPSTVLTSYLLGIIDMYLLNSNPRERTWSTVVDRSRTKWHQKMTTLKAKATDEGDRRRRDDDGWQTAMIMRWYTISFVIAIATPSLVFVVCVVFGCIRCTTLFSCYCLCTTLSFSSLLLFVIAIILRTTLSFVIATPSLLLFVVF